MKKVSRARSGAAKQITGHKSLCAFHQGQGEHGKIQDPQDKYELIVEEKHNF